MKYVVPTDTYDQVLISHMDQHKGWWLVTAATVITPPRVIYGVYKSYRTAKRAAKKFMDLTRDHDCKVYYQAGLQYWEIIP
jgi:hypothetical protein